MRFSEELEAKLASLPPRERRRALMVGKPLAKARLANMLDQTSRSHRGPMEERRRRDTALKSVGGRTPPTTA